MKNSLFLILTAASFAFMAWLFWHSFSNDAFDVFSALVLIILLVDNIRLRREVKKAKPSNPG